MSDPDDETDERIVPLRRIEPAPPPAPPAPKPDERVADADQNEADRSEPEGQPRSRGG